MSEMNNLFATENNAQMVSSRSLTGTAQLTNLANSIATTIINKMNANVEDYVEDIKKSQADNNAMDALIEKVNPLGYVADDEQYAFLRDLDEATIDGMLKSQQSKRSRCKSKVMTMDNYKSLMVGAICENIIRIVLGKAKTAGGMRRVAGSVEYTIEQLQALEIDQEKLKKEIRNVQSKKSIMKSKADFSETDEKWQQLLKVEQQLKDMRISSTPASTVYVEVDETKKALNDLMTGKDIHSMKTTDSKELLAQILNLVGGDTAATEEDAE